MEVIREALRTKPFQPFNLSLVDGRQLFVPHPDFVLVYARRVIYTNARDSSVAVLEPMFVLSLDYPAVGP